MKITTRRENENDIHITPLGNNIKKKRKKGNMTKIYRSTCYKYINRTKQRTINMNYNLKTKRITKTNIKRERRRKD